MNTDIPERVRVEDFEDDDQSYLERIGIESYSEERVRMVPTREWSDHITAPMPDFIDNDHISINDADGNTAIISATVMDHPVVNTLQFSLSAMEEIIQGQTRRIEQLEEKIRRLENGTL